MSIKIDDKQWDRVIHRASTKSNGIEDQDNISEDNISFREPNFYSSQDSLVFQTPAFELESDDEINPNNQSTNVFPDHDYNPDQDSKSDIVNFNPARASSPKPVTQNNNHKDFIASKLFAAVKSNNPDDVVNLADEALAANVVESLQPPVDWPALHWAAHLRSNAALYTLLKHGVMDPNMKDRRGNTPLHWAAMAGNTHGIQYLLDANAFLETINHNLATPLHFAAIGKHKDTYNLLTHKGSNQYIEDTFGRTPIMIAMRNKLITLAEEEQTLKLLHANQTQDLRRLSKGRRDSDDELPKKVSSVDEPKVEEEEEVVVGFGTAPGESVVDDVKNTEDDSSEENEEFHVGLEAINPTEVKQGLVLNSAAGESNDDDDNVTTTPGATEDNNVYYAGVEETNTNARLSVVNEHKLTTFGSMKDTKGTYTVTLPVDDNSLGLRFKAGKTSGTGVVIDSIDKDSKAERTGKFSSGDIVTHINNTDIREYPMLHIRRLIVSAKDQITFTVTEKPSSSEEEQDDEDDQHLKAFDTLVTGTSQSSTNLPEYDVEEVDTNKQKAGDQLPDYDVGPISYEPTTSEAKTKREKISVEFDQTDDVPLGLKLKKHPKTNAGAYVSGIVPDQKADQSGQFQVSDIILEINGVDITQFNMKQIGLEIKNKDTVTFLLERQVEVNDDDTYEPVDTTQDGVGKDGVGTGYEQIQLLTANEQRGDVEEVSALIDISDGNPLGLKLANPIGPDSGAKLTYLEPDGKANASGQVMVGDEVTHINGESILGSNMKVIGKLVKSSSSTILFTIRRPVQAQIGGDSTKAIVDEGQDTAAVQMAMNYINKGREKPADNNSEEQSIVVEPSDTYTEPFEVIITKGPTETFGLGFVGPRNTHEAEQYGNGIYISRVDENGRAKLADPRMTIGLQILNIDGEDVSEASSLKKDAQPLLVKASQANRIVMSLKPNMEVMQRYLNLAEARKSKQ